MRLRREKFRLSDLKKVPEPLNPVVLRRVYGTLC